MKKMIGITIDTNEFFSEVGDEEMIKHLENKGYGVIKPGESSKYINLEKSAGTEPFYKLLAKLIEEEKISLEMIIGHVVTKKIMENSLKIKS